MYMCMYVYICASAQARAPGGHRTTFLTFLKKWCLPYPLRQGLSLVWNLLMWLHWLTSKIPESAWFYLSSARITSLCHHARLCFVHGFREFNLCPHVSIACTLLNEPQHPKNVYMPFMNCAYLFSTTSQVQYLPHLLVSIKLLVTWSYCSLFFPK